MPMEKEAKPLVEIYADGACSGNPGPGGFGAIIRSGDRERELSGCEMQTTNNRMELMGVIAAFEALKRPCRVVVTTDSNYIVKGMNEWIHGWKRRNWKNSQNKDVMNRDLWERLLKTIHPHEVLAWKWIKGHNGHSENERCDRLAREAIMECRKRAVRGSEEA